MSAVLVAAALLVVSRADAFVQTRTAEGEVQLPGANLIAPDAARQQAMSSGAAWLGFRAKNGEWTALWNEQTGTPHRAFGKGIALAGFSNDAAGVDRAVRRFVSSNPELFGSDLQLVLNRAQRRGDKWYVSYTQHIDGLPVLFSDFEFRIGANGRLSMFGADAHRGAPGLTTAPRIAPAVARVAAHKGVTFDFARDRVEGADQLYLLPYPGENGRTLRVVYKTHVRTTNPEADWLTYVDASTGEVLYRTNRVREAISGTVTGQIHPTLPDDPKIARPLPDLFVQVGPNQVVTDTSGFYTANPAGTVTVSAQLKGRWAAAIRGDGAADASFSTSAPNPSTVNIPWGVSGTSHDAERDAYYHCNIAHARVKKVDPTLTTLDYQMPLTVNLSSMTCNATWNGTGINLFAAGGGCVNTAMVPDVIYHEYGHGVNDWTYVSAGGAGMFNGALHEGMADVNAMFISDDPIIGEGFSGPGTWVRRLDQGNRWPKDRGGEPHTDGLMVAGAFWDMRVRLGHDLAEALTQEARHGRPDDSSDILAFLEMFTEVLVADDNDANLANGTPHGADIIAAFNAHGIGTAFYIFFNPVVVANPPAGDLVKIESVVNYTGPSIAALNTSSPRVYWKVNRGSWNESQMTPTGETAHFAARVPVPEGSVVEYYLTATDTYGGINYSPSNAPAATYSFYVGTPTVAVNWDMETNPAWTVGSPSDNAITGTWVRENPSGTFLEADPPNPRIFVQPADDHTPAGTICWVTGNADSTLSEGNVVGYDDVDGGSTTLTTATFNALTGMEHPILEYWRWYSNNSGSYPSQDFWVVDISNNGGASWVSVENTTETTAFWKRILFRIEDYVTPTANMKMRFIAQDQPSGSVIEAAVDDFRLLAFAPGTVSAPLPAGAPLALAPAYPNPSHASVSFRISLPEAGHADLTLFDVNGRVMRTLLDGNAEAGTRSVTWDGLDTGGVRSPAGLYFARLRTPQGERVQRVVRSQ
jgi:hypothetical protein